MPIYRVNNKSYNIPEDMAGKFEQQFPDATVDVYNGSEHYSIPVQKKNSFLKDYPEATFDYPQQNDNNNVDKWEPTNEVKEYSLNNIPDMFRSKGNNLATRPLPQQDLFENNPSDLVRKIGIDQQQRVEQAQKSANDPYMKEQNLELFKRQNQEQINSVNELINAARQERAKERQQRVRSVGDGGIFSTMSQAYLAGEQNDTDKQLEYASTLMEQAQNITNEAKKKGNTNFFAGFARGFKDAPLDGWAMGLQDLKNYSAAKKVMDKVDKGEELTPSEDALMQALVTNAATQMYYSGDLGRGYKAGGVTAESLPFMFDMIAGMGAVQALTKPASKAIVKYAADKAAQMGLGRATTGLAKGAARTVAGLGDVAAHTATFGSARVAADYQRRGLGDVQVKPNADGTVSYDGRENVQTGAEALGKSIISTAAETGSELLGEYFAPMLGYIGRVTGANKVGKIIPASVGKAFKDVVNSQGFREMQEIARRAKISGPLGEYAEEVANNLVSTAIGDMTPEQLVDLDQNIDTFLGVAPMSALFGAAGTGGYLRDKYKNYRNMRNFETQMQDAMGEDWSGVREALQDADIETARNMVKDVLSSPMSPDMKKNAIKYISSALQEQTLQEADKQMMPEEIAVEKRNIINNLNETRSKISLNDEELNAIINSEEGYQAIISQFDPETANNIMKYKQAYDDFVNYNYWVQDQADNARRQAEAQVESLTNATTGTIMRVNSGLSTNPVNILRGNLVFDNEGKVDENQSDKTIYYMSEDGRVKMAPVSMFSSLVDNTPAEEMIQRAGNDAQEEVLQAEEAQINSIPAQEQQPIGPETRFTMGGNNYEVNRVTPDGYEVYLLDENGTPAQSQLMSEEEIRNAINGQQPANAEETQPSVTEQPVQEETSEQPVQENQTAMSRIPLNERGEQDFEAAPVADTSAALLEISDNVDDAKDTATQMIDHYNNELKKAEKAKSTGNTIQEIVKMKQEKKANIKAINDKISYWNQVAADLEAKRPTGLIAQAEEKAKENQQRLASMTAEEQQAAQQEVQKKIDAGAFERKEPRKKIRYVKEDADLEPSITPQEHVLREIATGRVSFSLSDTEGAQGLSSHLGYSNSPEERKKLVWALSSDGLTPEAAAEQIHADMPENLQGMVTDQDVFNMIINAFQEYGSPSKMWDAAKNMHGTDIEENIPGYEEDQERQLIEWEASENRMSVPEWIAYSDYIEEELNNLYSSVTDEELNTIFEQIINDYERRAETESAGSTDGQTDSEQGNTVQPERESDNEGRTGEVEEQPEPAIKTDGESGSVVPEPEGVKKNKTVKKGDIVSFNGSGRYKVLFTETKDGEKYATIENLENKKMPSISTEIGNLSPAIGDIEAARAEVDQNPTEAQKEAGNFKPENLTTSAPISSRLIQIQQGETVISEDKRVIVEKNTGWRSGYALKVPKSKKQGGEFFEDNKLRSLADNKEFTTRGNYMVADISSDNLSKVLDRLSNMGVTVSKKAKLENSEDVRFREETPRTIVDPTIKELIMQFEGEDISRYPYVDKRSDPNNDPDILWGYSEPLYNGINVMDSEEVPELIKDIIREDEYEIDRTNIAKTLERNIEWEGGYEEESAKPIIDALNWFMDNQRNFKMSDKVNLITDSITGKTRFRFYEKDRIQRKLSKTAKKLNVPVEVITSVDQIKDNSVRSAIEKGRKVKGWYSLSDNKVYVYLPNATSMEDVNQTILHEGVAHYGLRQLVGEDRMDDFLDDVFANVTDEVRKKIIDTLPRYGYNSRIATEEYMARMAENGVDVSVWQRIKQAFNSLMRRMGINIKISDNELRYILWRSRQNLDKNKPLDMAKDVAMQYQMGVGNYFREDTDGSIGMYEQSLKGWKYKAQEAYQDSMLALKNLQEVIAKVSGKPIKSFENAYMAENQLSSKNTSEAEVYYKKHYQPMLQEAGKMMKKYGLTQKGIERYMMLAHGIERNVELTFREQLDEFIKNKKGNADQFIQDFKDEKERLRKLYSGYEYLKELSDYIGGVNDYSATQAILNSMDGEEHDNFQEDALNYVKDFEQTYDVKELWNKTNDATKTTLRKAYDSGMMGKEQYSNVNNMYMYYVPLRGWDEQTAEDVYEYIDSERNPVSSVLKSAKGRKSIPDEIFATIGNMAESAIMQGNRNMMKQSFMSMVINHPTDIATLKKAWYVYDPVKDEWNISMPDIQESDNAETIAEKLKNHEEQMKQLKENGLATQKPNGLNINYRINKNNISQHVVQVKNGGKDYVIYINGNPRAAQAINGLTNPNVEQNPIFRSIATANRWLAANFTTRNPAFVLSNLVRDLIFSNVAVSIKEDGKYSSRFRKNILKAMPVVLRNLNGKPNNTEADRYFQEFIENGGETGYMHLNDVEKYKKKVRKELSKINGEMGSAKMAMDFAIDRLEDFNRWAEDISRFTTYMTSRQMGRSITESVNDAKEVTVNFNKKGAGYKTGGFFGMTSGIFRNLYLFFNASVQSLTNFKRLYDKQPVKFYSALGGFMSAGFLMPMINNVLYSVFGGGDDDPYNDLPEWVRRNNLCIYTGNDTFLTIPLPIELRAFYGLGDYAYQLTTGKEKPSATNIAKGTVGQLADLLPLNPTGNEGLKTFMPDIMSPIFEAYVWNQDFTGKPVAKISPFNERDPEWKRVYKGTSGWLVDTSKFLNDISNGSGPGSEFRKGFIDFNPAKVEHLLESYFGGMAKTFNQAGKTIYYGGKSLIEQQKDEDLVMRNVPIVNRFLNTVDERNAFSGINTEYFNLRDEMDQFKYELNGVKKSGNKDEYKEMLNSDLYDKYQKYKPYQKKLKKLNDMAKESQGEDRKEIEDMIIETRRELLEEVK